MIKLVQTCSNWIKLVQTWSNWIKLDQIGSNWIKLDQIESMWYKMDQIGSKISNWIKMDQIGLNLIQIDQILLSLKSTLKYPFERSWTKCFLVLFTTSRLTNFQTICARLFRPDKMFSIFRWTSPFLFPLSQMKNWISLESIV